ncbi:hypothetical protein [Nocardia wallacei]|uniref:hypothetical protein n=1 Tax=Nocardia wallacei TaxID=480035 RepID=UPI002456C52D|nr:hypothetical protein [Nocardia wallacei]
MKWKSLGVWQPCAEKFFEKFCRSIMWVGATPFKTPPDTLQGTSGESQHQVDARAIWLGHPAAQRFEEKCA